ncbi:hypothetical protein D3C81_1660470 [compost metagenome]
MKCRIKLSQQLNKLQSIHARHTNISNNKAWLVLFIFFKGFVTVSRGIHYVISESFPVNKYTKTFSQLRFVVYYKNFNHRDSPLPKKFEPNILPLNSNRPFQRNSIHNFTQQ